MSPAEKRNRRIMKVGEFKKLLEKAIEEGNIKDSDDILIVNAGKDVRSNIFDIHVSHFSDDKKRVIITNLY